MNHINDFSALQRRFAEAADCHGQGDLAQAERGYQSLLTEFFKMKDGIDQNTLLLAILNNLTVLYIQTERYNQSIALTQEVLKWSQGKDAATVDPHFYVEAYKNLGTALEILGRAEEARHATEAAIRLAPNRIDLYRVLVKLKHFAENDGHLQCMERLAQHMEMLTSEEQMQLHFALGKALADLGRHEQAFAHLLAGNTIKRRQIVYDEAKVLRSLDQIRAAFTPELMQKNRGWGHPSSVPVFIVGMMRSGTTLVEQILASHPQVFGGGELNYFRETVAQLLGSASAPLTFSDDVLSDDVPVLAGAQLRQLGGAYLERLGAATSSAQRITDKMTLNFRFVGLIHLALPHARIIHCLRDPIDICLSCFSLLFANGHSYAYDLGELGRFYRGYARLMAHWRSVLPRGVMLEIDYENLVNHFDHHAREIVAHCGVEWDDACLAFYNTQRPVLTASMI